MDSNDIKVFFELLHDDEYCLLYNGNFVDAVTSKIINITKVSLIQRGELIKTQNRFAYLIAECFQNIIRHGGHKEHNINDKPLPGFFMAKIKSNYYDLVTGNLIDHTNIPPLQKQFDDVNSLSKDELKTLYKKALAEGELSEKGGAGLGLIDMAKKSAQKLEYEFLNATDKQSMFYQRVVMAADIDKYERTGNDNNLEFGIKLHKTMVERNILILQKSDFARNSILPMLTIVEENVDSEGINALLVKSLYLILVELFQIVKPQSDKTTIKREGILFISKHKKVYSICSGYYVSNKKINDLKKFMKKISGMNNAELETIYLKRLKNSDNTKIKPTKTLVEKFGRIISERISFSVHDIDSKTSFFSIYVDI